MTEIYLHIAARMADYIATHPYALGPLIYAQQHMVYPWDWRYADKTARA